MKEMKNPVFDEKESSHMLRGGCRRNSPKVVSVSYRYDFHPADSNHEIGFRLVRNQK